MVGEVVPVVSLKPLLNIPQSSTVDVRETCDSLVSAARNVGFFYVRDHGIPTTLLKELERTSRSFFELPLEKKMKIKMIHGGKAWRGYFPPGDELTSGVPDSKEGIYFGSELDINHDKVAKGVPLHGPNLWPHEVPELRNIVLEYMRRLTDLGHLLMKGFAIGLRLDENYFKRFFGEEPIVLFRVFNYPKSEKTEGWGVGEHTDYGFLTILKTDENPGLQIKGLNETWIDVPPIKDTFIVNLGDQLEIATKGLFKATPHRVKIERSVDRLSWPFFFDPSWDSIPRPVDASQSDVLQQWLDNGNHSTRQRWDGKNLLNLSQNFTYGEYLVEKVSKCFPQLFQNVV